MKTHSGSGLEICDIFPCFLDYPSYLMSKCNRKRHRAWPARAIMCVRMAYAGCLNTDKHVSRTKMWQIKLLFLQRVFLSNKPYCLQGRSFHSASYYILSINY
jgi:hypothetical protein